MSFINVIREKLESQQIYTGLSGKYEHRFVVDGVEYTLLANSIAGNGSEDFNTWMLEFENSISHRICTGDSNSKIGPAFAEAVNTFIKEKNPFSFFTYGSSIQSIKSILENLKKKIKKYNLIDDTADRKNEETKEIIPGNEIGKMTWTKMVPQEVVDTEDRDAIVSDKFKPEYELPKDIKTNKAHMSGTSKKDKLDKGDKAYELKTESFADFKARKLNEEEDFEPVEPDDDDCFYSPSGSLGSKTSVRCGGKFIGEFNSDEEALEAIRNWQDKNKYWPNIWFVSDHGNAILVDKEGNEIKESIQEGVGNIAKLASAAIRKLSDKVKGAWKKVTEIAGSEEALKKWVDENKEDLAHAMDIAKHMMDKKQLTFEGTKVSYSMLQENLLDLVAQKTPNVLAAAILILSIMGSGQKVFGANDSGSEAISKIKQNAKEIVEIVKHQGDQVGKNVIKDIEKAKKDAEKEAKDIKGKAEEKGKEAGEKVKEFSKKVGEKTKDAGEKVKEFGQKVKKDLDIGAEHKRDKKEKAGQQLDTDLKNLGGSIKKGAEKVGDAAKSKAEELKQGFQKFLQKKKEEKKPEEKKMAPFNSRNVA